MTCPSLVIWQTDLLLGSVSLERAFIIIVLIVAWRGERSRHGIRLGEYNVYHLRSSLAITFAVTIRSSPGHISSSVCSLMG